MSCSTALITVSGLLLYVLYNSEALVIPSTIEEEGVTQACMNTEDDKLCQELSINGHCSDLEVAQWCKMACGGCQVLPIHGGYTKWGPWSPCNRTCAGGLQQRSRSCSNPQPANGGKDCGGLGPAIETRKCNTQPCSVCTNLIDDSNCHQWFNAGHCSNPTIKNWCLGTCGGCQGFSIHGGYTKWGSWSPCSQSCGGGLQQRSRSCSKPQPRNGGRDCSGLGPAIVTRRCNTQRCPVCSDILDGSSCKQWLNAGQCSNPTIGKLCLDTCGKCTVCKNILNDSRCQQWFNTGHCSNPTIGRWCKKTCGFCV